MIKTPSQAQPWQLSPSLIKISWPSKLSGGNLFCSSDAYLFHQSLARFVDTMSDEDFDEEEVWAVVKDGSPKGTTNTTTTYREDCSPSHSPSSSSSTRRASSKMNIPMSPSDQCGGSRAVRPSAPVNIPEWSKIYKHKVPGLPQNDDDDDDDDIDDDCKAPPHVLIAKKMARTQISSSSVCEGAGRTLKGRDLSKVRNAVLTKTGFLE